MQRFGCNAWNRTDVTERRGGAADRVQEPERRVVACPECNGVPDGFRMVIHERCRLGMEDFEQAAQAFKKWWRCGDRQRGCNERLVDVELAIFAAAHSEYRQCHKIRALFLFHDETGTVRREVNGRY